MRYILILALFSLAFAPTSRVSNELFLDGIMNSWHQAATEANFDNYFGLMTDDFVFLGTAPGERWTKEEFAKFSKPYFDKGKAWDFKVVDRDWEFSKNKKIAWFDENLNTWMQGCRGSGIMVKQKGKWQLAYYNLTVLIENEKIQKFIELRKEKITE